MDADFGFWKKNPRNGGRGEPPNIPNYKRLAMATEQMEQIARANMIEFRDVAFGIAIQGHILALRALFASRDIDGE